MLVNVAPTQLVGPYHPFGPYVDYITLSNYTIPTAAVTVAITPKALSTNITSVAFQGPFLFQTHPPIYQNSFAVINPATGQVQASRSLPTPTAVHWVSGRS